MSTILQSDRVQVNNRWVHCNGDVLGFLTTGGSWSFYMNNGGSLWTADYGWLHDKFMYNQTRTAGYFIGRDGGNRSSGGSGNISVRESPISYLVVNNSSGYDQYYTTHLRYYNCNCTCK